VLNMLPDLVDKIVATVQGVSIDRVAVIDNGTGGASGGIPGVMAQLPAALVSMTEQIEAATGVDILAALREPGSSGDDDEMSELPPPPPAPVDDEPG